MKQFQTVVIGAGPAGYEAALELAKAGIKTLLIDKSKEDIGGVCLNKGCIPAKNYLQYAEFAVKATFFGSKGLELELKGLNIEQLALQTTLLKDELRTGILWLLEQAGVEMLYGTASFKDDHHIKVLDEIIEFDHCLIATGSAVKEMPGIPLDCKRIISSNEVFQLRALPSSVAIIGGGAIACEFATFFSAFGAKVTMIVRGQQLLSNEDEDVSKALLRNFKKLSIDVLFSTMVSSVQEKENGLELFFDSENTKNIPCDLLLCAIGRTPYTQGLKLENAGIACNEKGFVAVNRSFQANKEHIFAAGDCIDSLGYAHVAYTEGKIVAHNIITGDTKTNTHISPMTIFSNPQIAKCGLNEKEALEYKIEVDVKKAYFKANAKAKISGDDFGFAKIIVSKQSDIILGGCVVGMQATEIIHLLVMAIEKQLTFYEVSEMIYAHPTISEIIRNF